MAKSWTTEREKAREIKDHTECTVTSNKHLISRKKKKNKTVNTIPIFRSKNIFLSM